MDDAMGVVEDLDELGNLQPRFFLYGQLRKRRYS
jgi:hypothetical protein